MKEQMTTHEEEIVRLRRIEGQIRGIQKMIEEKRYCIDIERKIEEMIQVLQKFRKY